MKSLVTLIALAFAAPAFAGGSVVSGGFKAPTAVVVEFVSFGAGIDFDALKNLRTAIEEGKKAGQIVYSIEKRLGMEGETKVCLQLRDYPTAQNYETKLQMWIGSRLTKVEGFFDCNLFDRHTSRR